MSWKCEKCDQTFNEKPLGHGNLVGNPTEGFKDEKCDGRVVHVSRPYYELDSQEYKKGV
jgi:hypothetical protein